MGRGAGGSKLVMTAREKNNSKPWIAPNRNLDAPTRNSQNTKHKHADPPAKKRPTPCLIPRVASVFNRGNCGWNATHFPQCVLRERCFVWCWFCGPTKEPSTLVRTLYTYICIIGHYVNICTYTHQHRKPQHQLCSWSGYEAVRMQSCCAQRQAAHLLVRCVACRLEQSAEISIWLKICTWGRWCMVKR